MNSKCIDQTFPAVTLEKILIKTKIIMTRQKANFIIENY